MQNKRTCCHGYTCCSYALNWPSYRLACSQPASFFSHTHTHAQKPCPLRTLTSSWCKTQIINKKPTNWKESTYIQNIWIYFFVNIFLFYYCRMLDGSVRLCSAKFCVRFSVKALTYWSKISFCHPQNLYRHKGAGRCHFCSFTSNLSWVFAWKKKPNSKVNVKRLCAYCMLVANLTYDAHF